MAKLSVKAKPTFKTKVGIPVAGDTPADVQFEFKHRTRSEFADWLKKLEGKDRGEAVMDCVVGWELEEAFSAESVKELNENYLGASDAIVNTYIQEISQARRGN